MINLLPLPTLLLLAATILSPVSAVPTRANCRCTKLSTTDNQLISTHTPSTFQGTPDPCAKVAASLEILQRTDPSTFQSIFSENDKSNATPTKEDLQPLTTSVLLKLAERTGYSNLGVVLPSAPAEDEEMGYLSGEAIVCQSDSETFRSEFQASQTVLFCLQVIVALAFLACAAEGISLIFDWFTAHKNIKGQPLRLAGSEKRLTAHSIQSSDSLYSPGVEKKMNAYATIDRRSPESHDEDDDDELKWPVL